MQQIRIEELAREIAKKYLSDELIKRRLNKLDDDDCIYLYQSDDIFTLNHFYGLFFCDTLVGFCIIPTYEESCLVRIYVEPEYRNQGIGTYAIEKLKITKLHCLTDNVEALKLYQFLGFKTSFKYTYSVCMERTL